MIFLLARRVIIFAAPLVLALPLGLGDEDLSAIAMDPQRIISLLKSSACNKIGGDYPAEKDKPATRDICELRNIIYWDAGLEIDCDGIDTRECNPGTDPDFRGDTALRDSSGRFLDAAGLPYVVIPYPSSGHWDYTKSGITLGTAVAVIYEGRIQCGVLGDIGTMGEASYAMAQRLGIDPDPRQGGTYSEVTYIIFKHSLVLPAEDQKKALSLCTTGIKEFFRSSGR